jgi:hypothetical protein
MYNNASGIYGTIAGGANINVSGDYAAVAGSSYITVTGNYAAVGGGQYNSASGQIATVSGGYQNTASLGAATVGGGQDNTATGIGSFAAGQNATAGHNGSFVWGDGSGPARSTNTNQFIATVSNRVGFYTSSGSCTYFSGANWTCSSDRNLKENFTLVNKREILERLGQIPITRWNMIGQDPNVHHLGPVAQDFYAAFSLGQDDEHINTGDAQGVAFAAYLRSTHRLAALWRAQDVAPWWAVPGRPDVGATLAH